MTPTHTDRMARRRQIADAVAGGKTISDTCREFGVSRSLVYEACKEHNARPAPELAASTWKVLAALLNTRRSVQSIADEHSMSPQAVDQVRQRAKRVGIKVPARKRENGHG